MNENKIEFKNYHPQEFVCFSYLNYIHHKFICFSYINLILTMVKIIDIILKISNELLVNFEMYKIIYFRLNTKL